MRRAKRKAMAKQKRKRLGRPDRDPRKRALADHLAAVAALTDAGAEVVNGVIDDLEAGEEVTINLDLRPRAVSEAELEEWHAYAAKIGLGENRGGVEVVVIPDAEQSDDDLLAKLHTRARLRLRDCRLQEDGTALWFELHGPDGWVRVGRKIQVAITLPADRETD